MKRILVCTDGSQYAAECCKYGAWVASKADAYVDVLYVSDLRDFQVPVVADLGGGLGLQPYVGLVDELRSLEATKAACIRDASLAIFEAAGVGLERVSFHHETGFLVDVIDRFSNPVDLILLGKRGEHANFASEHLGSMLERLIRATHKPCLVTSRSFRAVERILIAYDGGCSSRDAMQALVATGLAGDFECHVITVVDGDGHHLASERLAEAEQMLTAAGIEPKCQMLAGEVESTISDYVHEVQIDLLVTGAYGHSRIRDFLIGSTTTGLLRTCHIPILCYR